MMMPPHSLRPCTAHARLTTPIPPHPPPPLCLLKSCLCPLHNMPCTCPPHITRLSPLQGMINKVINACYAPAEDGAKVLVHAATTDWAADKAGKGKGKGEPLLPHQDLRWGCGRCCCMQACGPRLQHCMGQLAVLACSDAWCIVCGALQPCTHARSQQQQQQQQMLLLPLRPSTPLVI
jgi:hypothetical protein